MKRLHLVDAYALIFRAYYAFIRMPRINSKGTNTSAVFGFLNTFEELLRRENPSHIAVVFDPSGPTFRHEQFESYKANRESTPEDIRVAVPIIKSLMAAYGVRVLQVPGYEADDVIGTLAVKASGEGYDVYMITPDKDYEQLVTDRISIIKPRSGQKDIEVVGPQEVIAKWGIDSPKQVIDLLGLMGDSVDNIPGCPGVGEKTAVKLIREYGSIEGVVENVDSIKGTLRQKVSDNVRQILDSKYLATICTDVPIEFVPEEYVVGEQNTAALMSIFTDLEFKSHLSKLKSAVTDAEVQSDMPSLFDENVSETQSAPSQADTVIGNIGTVEHHYRTVSVSDGLPELKTLLAEADVFSFSLLTSSPDSMMCRPVGMSFSVSPHEAYYLPLPESYADARDVLSEFAPFFSSDKKTKVGHSLKHQMIVLARYDVEMGGKLFDTEVAHYLLQPELKHDIDYISETFLHYTPINFDDFGRKYSIDELPKIRVADYAAESADVVLQLYAVLSSQMERHKLSELFENVEIPLLSVLARMEINGVLIDDFALSQISAQLTARMNKIERNIRQIAGADINLSSPKQVGELLFDTLRLSDKARKTKKGHYSTDEETLESLRHKHPVVGDILEYRGLRKLLSTYIDALPRLINNTTGKVHTSFNQTVTATGRLSSSNPNLQNIPIRNESGREIRRAFIPSEGCVFLSADYSQVELRIMAHLSSDPHMLEAFRSDDDIHSATAAKVYHVPIEEVTADMRRKAKTANFGIIYGISIFGLSERLSISRKEARDLIENYFASFPKVREYIDEEIENARKAGYVETLMKRRRYLPDINSHNTVVRGYAERNAVNAPIQGAAADIIKVAMIRIDRCFRAEGLKAKMILQVHDELDFDVPTDEVSRVTEIVRREMEGAFRLNVPLRVDIGTGANWLEAH